MAAKKNKIPDDTSAIIEAKTQVFLKAGGEVEYVKTGVTGQPDKRTKPVQITLGGRDG